MNATTSVQPDLYVKLAVVKAIIAAAQQTETATKEALTQVMAPKDRKTAALNGADLGTISYTQKAGAARVTDRDAWTEWAIDNAPTEVRCPVTVDADELLAALLWAEEPDDTNTQAAYRRHCHDTVMAQIRTATPRVNAAWEKSILDRAARDGGAWDPNTGEEIPGIEVTPPSPGYITARISDAQSQAILDAWQAGDLGDVLEVIATPPQIEA